MSFDSCVLNHCIFYDTKLKGTYFKNSQLHQIDFGNCDLTKATFDNCDLAGATFENTILEKTDFITASNFKIDPELNKIKKAKFSKENVIGLLAKYDIKIE